LVNPYSTWEFAGSSVVQVMVADVSATLIAATLEIAGGVVRTDVGVTVGLGVLVGAGVLVGVGVATAFGPTATRSISGEACAVPVNVTSYCRYRPLGLTIAPFAPTALHVDHVVPSADVRV
jgi:hypothetical protein